MYDIKLEQLIIMKVGMAGAAESVGDRTKQWEATLRRVYQEYLAFAKQMNVPTSLKHHSPANVQAVADANSYTDLCWLYRDGANDTTPVKWTEQLVHSLSGTALDGDMVSDMVAKDKRSKTSSYGFSEYIITTAKVFDALRTAFLKYKEHLTLSKLLHSIPPITQLHCDVIINFKSQANPRPTPFQKKLAIRTFHSADDAPQALGPAASPAAAAGAGAK